MINCGVYEIVNKLSTNKYVGSTNNFPLRFWNHKKKLKENLHHAPHLQAAWNMYGEENFEFRPLIICSKEDALYYEQKLLDSKEYIYNVNKTVNGGKLKGVKLSEECKCKISLALKGKPGNRHTEQSKLKLSIAHKGKPLSDAHKLAISQATKGHFNGGGVKGKIWKFIHKNENFIGTYREFAEYMGALDKLRVMRSRFITVGHYKNWFREEV